MFALTIRKRQTKQSLNNRDHQIKSKLLQSFVLSEGQTNANLINDFMYTKRVTTYK